LRRLLAGFLLLGAQAGWAVTDGPAPALVRVLAPSGRLRVAINLGNPVLAQRGSAGLRGVSVALARELGRRLNLAVELIPFDAAGQVTDALAQGAWDLAFLAIRQALAVPRGREACAAYLNGFLEELKASGFVALELAASGQADAGVAPPED